MSAKWAWGGLNWHYMYMESGYLVHCVNILTLTAIFLTKPTMLMWSPYMHLYVYLIINNLLLPVVIITCMSKAVVLKTLIQPPHLILLGPALLVSPVLLLMASFVSWLRISRTMTAALTWTLFTFFEVWQQLWTPKFEIILCTWNETF